MNKRLKIFPTLAKLAIIMMVISLIPSLPASAAGNLTVVRMDLSSNIAAATSVGLTIIFRTPTQLVATDKIVVSFRSGAGFDVAGGNISGATTIFQDATDTPPAPATSVTLTSATSTEANPDTWVFVLNDTIAASNYVKIVVTGDLTNPADGTYIVDLTTTSTADVVKDAAAAGVLIGTNQVTISGTVEPTLTLAIVALTTDDATTTCPLGTITPSNIETCGYRSKVSTNATGGYTAYIRSGGDLVSGANTIDAVSSSPISATTEEYGINTSDTATDILNNNTTKVCNDGSGDDLDNQSAIPVPASALTTSDQSFVTTATSVANEYTTICHAAAISGTTAAGVYTQTVTITIVGNF